MCLKEAQDRLQTLPTTGPRSPRAHVLWAVVRGCGGSFSAEPALQKTGTRQGESRCHLSSSTNLHGRAWRRGPAGLSHLGHGVGQAGKLGLRSTPALEKRPAHPDRALWAPGGLGTGTGRSQELAHRPPSSSRTACLSSPFQTSVASPSSGRPL